jgi:hypothetical protein
MTNDNRVDAHGSPIILSAGETSVPSSTINARSVVVHGRFLEHLPLLTVVAEDDQGYLIALRDIEEFAGAGA